MNHRRHLLSFAVLTAVFLFSSAPARCGSVKKETIKTSILEFPQIPVEGLDYAGLKAEVAYGDVEITGTDLRKKEIPCAFKDEEGRTRLKTTKMLPIHYYRVNYKGAESYLVLKDASGRVVWTTQLGDRAASWEDFGGKNCGHISKGTLDNNWGAGREAFVEALRKKERESLTIRAQRAVDDAVFPAHVNERFKLYWVKGDEYADINDAFKKAERAFDLLGKKESPSESRSLLTDAAAAWEKALGEQDLADKDARINRKVVVGLHYNLGLAKMFLHDYPAAALNFKKCKQLMTFDVVSRGEGPIDLYQRARQRQPGYEANRSWADDEGKTARLMEAADALRGKLKVQLVGGDDLAGFRQQHKDAARSAAHAAHATEQSETAEAVASGAENPYASKVQHTAMQGFTLFLMPYFGQKVDAFPEAICELTQLNDLRIAGHGIDSVPECIGNLTALKKLDLSKNKLTTLPASIAKLKNLKKLTVKKNQFSKEEQARIEGLLPDAKVKF